MDIDYWKRKFSKNVNIFETIPSQYIQVKFMISLRDPLAVGIILQLDLKPNSQFCKVLKLPVPLRREVYKRALGCSN